MIRNLFLFLFLIAMFSCVNNNHHTTIVVDCKNDSTIVTATDSLVVVRVLLHDTVYVREKNKHDRGNIRSDKNRKSDAFSETMPKFD